MNKLPPIIHESWHELLEPLFEDAKMNMIKEKIREAIFYPSSQLVFRVFSMPIEEIKVVILGQDPYIKPNEAIGYAFAVPYETNTPPSLKVIYNEINRSEAKQHEHGNRTLQHWINQGVFLLNTALTVEAGKSGSHSMYWQWFTRQVVDIISKHHPSIWLLWGSKAQTFESYINRKVVIIGTIAITNNIEAIVNTVNYVLKAPHPVAETYDSNTAFKFTGCNHFNLCNEVLKLKGQTEINW